MSIKNKFLSSIFILLMMTNQVSYSQEQQSSAFGSVLGAALGGVIGYQFGGGTGKYVSTAVGTLIGSQIGKNVQQNYNQNNQYKPDYTHPVEMQTHNPYNTRYEQYQTQQQYSHTIIVVEDDYLIKQRLSDQAKRRNMVRNGELEPYELDYDQSTAQTSWDDPDN